MKKCSLYSQTNLDMNPAVIYKLSDPVQELNYFFIHKGEILTLYIKCPAEKFWLKMTP